MRCACVGTTDVDLDGLHAVCCYAAMSSSCCLLVAAGPILPAVLTKPELAQGQCLRTVRLFVLHGQHYASAAKWRQAVLE